MNPLRKPILIRVAFATWHLIVQRVAAYSFKTFLVQRYGLGASPLSADDSSFDNVIFFDSWLAGQSANPSQIDKWSNFGSYYGFAALLAMCLVGKAAVYSIFRVFTFHFNIKQEYW